jgi:hypothetical protein
MPNPTSIPGAKGQPDMDFVGGGFDTMGLAHTKSPSTDYMDKKGNPLQETAPTQVKAWSNDSEEKALGQTSNEINGGRSLTGGGTT